MKEIHNYTTALLLGLTLLFATSCTVSAGLKIGAQTAEHQLSDGQWILLELEGKEITKLPEREAPFIAFEADSDRFFGYGGCNRFFGSYTSEEKGKLSLGNIASTRMYCGEESPEDQFLLLLAEVEGYKIQGESLRLLDTQGEPLLLFRLDSDPENE